VLSNTYVNVFFLVNIEISGKNWVRIDQPLPVPTLVSEVKELSAMKGMSNEMKTNEQFHRLYHSTYSISHSECLGGRANPLQFYK